MITGADKEADKKKAVASLLAKAKALLQNPPLPHLAFLSIPGYQKAITLAPERLEIRLLLANAYWELGQSAEARAVCEEVTQLSPSTVESRLLHAIFQLPMLYRDLNEASVSRKAYEQEITSLAKDTTGNLAACLRLAAWADKTYPYYLPYQGLNDVSLQRIYGEMMCRAMGAAYPDYVRPLEVPATAPQERLRIGIVSSHFHCHSNWRAIMAGWLSGLDSSRFAIHAYSLGTKQDDCTATARALSAHFVTGERPFEEWGQTILGDRLHVLLYPAVGTYSLLTKLAMLRLAPVQCVAAGHCVTSGLPTMDYFLSAELTEPEDGDSHYTEKLVRLPGLGFRYTRPSVAAPARTRESFGLRRSACVFLSPNSLIKYLPEHDALYAQIAARAGDCQIVFVRHAKRDMISEQFEQRLRKAFASHGVDWDRHVVLLPRLNRADYNDLQVHSDVYLDSIGWNGGTTTSLALGYELPTVTLTGPVFRGRMGMAMLRLVGAEETVARTPEQYVDLAVRLAREPQWRQELRQRISRGKHRIYDDAAVPAGLSAFLEGAVAAADSVAKLGSTAVR